MAGLELWLVRHGETHWSADGKVTGSTDVDLTEKGRTQALNLRPRLGLHTFDGAWSSDLRRAQETGRLAWGTVQCDARLRELDFGTWEGLVWEHMEATERQKLLDFEGFCAPGGESVSLFRSRVLDFVEALNPGRHLLFVHAAVIRLVLREVGADRFLPPTSLAAIDWTRKALLFIEEGA